MTVTSNGHVIEKPGCEGLMRILRWTIWYVIIRRSCVSVSVSPRSTNHSHHTRTLISHV